MKPFIFLSILMLSALSQAQLAMTDGRVRAMPPGQPNTAAFLTLTNKSDQDIELIAASTSVAKKAEYHSHTKDDKGVMRMAKEDSVKIAAGQTFEFKTGGYHIMIMGLKAPLTPGQTVQITLTDTMGKTYPLEFPVVSIMAEKSNQDHSHHHH
jgi:copper(I)-binding protein